MNYIANSVDPDQTDWMCQLMWIYSGCTKVKMGICGVKGNSYTGKIRVQTVMVLSFNKDQTSKYVLNIQEIKTFHTSLVLENQNISDKLSFRKSKHFTLA
jgi:hypothetical protein